MHAFIVDLSNLPGSLASVAEALGEHGINITGSAGATAGNVGSLALVVDDHDGARSVFAAHAWTYREVPLVTASLEHRPGSLGEAARRIADAGINVETMFPTGMDGDRVQIAFGVSDPDAARGALGELAAG
jgi:hypothetical protein